MVGRSSSSSVILVVALASVGCGLARTGEGPPYEQAEASTDATITAPEAAVPDSDPDAGAETSTLDAPGDTAVRDSGSPDTGVLDAHAEDADAADVADSAKADSGSLDTGAPSDSGTPDSATDAACGDAETSSSPITAHQTPGPINVDGNLAEWPCSAFVEINASTSPVTLGSGASLSGRFAVLWDSGHVYVAVYVLDPSVSNDGGGGNPTVPWQNDAVEGYFSGDTNPNGNYSSIDHQFIVDYKNLALDYQYSSNSYQGFVNPGFTSATRIDSQAGAWSLEIQMDASQVGMSSITAGGHIGFDLALDHGNGAAQLDQLVWYLAPPMNCSCTNCCCGQNPSSLYCDVLRFGQVNFAM